MVSPATNDILAVHRLFCFVKYLQPKRRRFAQPEGAASRPVQFCAAMPPELAAARPGFGSTGKSTRAKRTRRGILKGSGRLGRLVLSQGGMLEGHDGALQNNRRRRQ